MIKMKFNISSLQPLEPLSAQYVALENAIHEQIPVIG